MRECEPFTVVFLASVLRFPVATTKHLRLLSLLVIMKLMNISTATITSKGQIVIPKESRQRAGFREGDKVVVLALEDRVEVFSLSEFEERMAPYLASLPALQDWESPEEEKAWKHLQ
jgi:AbrB family looped-hinge helix DNA binding protein